jgi:hypothetical protein
MPGKANRMWSLKRFRERVYALRRVVARRIKRVGGLRDVRCDADIPRFVSGGTAMHIPLGRWACGDLMISLRG